LQVLEVSLPAVVVVGTRKRNRLFRQGKDLIERRFISDEGFFAQTPAGISKGGQIHFEQAADALIGIEAEAVTIGYGNQEQIEGNFGGREVFEESCGNEAMVDPAKGALDCAKPLGIDDFLKDHKDTPVMSD
jgi:hypothetical protein